MFFFLTTQLTKIKNYAADKWIYFRNFIFHDKEKYSNRVLKVCLLKYERQMRVEEDWLLDWDMFFQLVQQVSTEHPSAPYLSVDKTGLYIYVNIVWIAMYFHCLITVSFYWYYYIYEYGEVYYFIIHFILV